MKRFNLVCFYLILAWASAGMISVYASGGPNQPSDSVGISADSSMDSSTRSLSIIEYDHREIHSGYAFTLSSSSAVLGSGNTFNILIMTSSSSKLLHLINESEATGEGEIALIENPTITSSGTATTIFNRRRPSSITSNATGYVNCSFTGGTILRSFRVGAGKSTGGSSRSASERILSPSTPYVIQFTSRATGVYIELKSDWYEHEDKK